MIATQAFTLPIQGCTSVVLLMMAFSIIIGLNWTLAFEFKQLEETFFQIKKVQDNTQQSKTKLWRTVCRSKASTGSHTDGSASGLMSINLADCVVT